MNNDAGGYLYGVRGWLRFLVIVLMVLGPLYGIAQTLGEFSRAEAANPALQNTAFWANYKTAVWVLMLVSVSVSIFAGRKLNKVFRWDSVQFAIKALWFIGPGMVLMDWAVAATTFGSAAGALFSSQAIGSYVGSLVGSTIGATLWTAYLLRSRRVRNTYPRPYLGENPVARADRSERPAGYE